MNNSGKHLNQTCQLFLKCKYVLHTFLRIHVALLNHMAPFIQLLFSLKFEQIILENRVLVLKNINGGLIYRDLWLLFWR